MQWETFTTESGYMLPSVHSFPPFFTKQHNPSVLSQETQQWITLILSYARFRGIWSLSIDDAEREGGEWSEIFWNPRIRRQIKASYLEYIVTTMVAEGSAFYEPLKQTRIITLCWKKPEEWATVIYDWVSSTGQFNTIMTMYELQNPEDSSCPWKGITRSMLQRALQVLCTARLAQQIEGDDGDGVRFFRDVVK